MRLRACLLALLVLVSGPSWAVDYYWYASNPNGGGRYAWATNQSSASAACADAIGTGKKWPAGSTVIGVGVNQTTGNATCAYRFPNGATGSDVHAIRVGTQCADGSTYNAVLAVCEAPPANIGEQCGTDSAGKPQFINSQGECVASSELDQAAVCKALSDKGTVTKRVFVAFDSDGNPQAPAISDKFGCVAELALTGVDLSLIHI